MSHNGTASVKTEPTMKIPILLLKTRSQPHDTYEEFFSGKTVPTESVPSVSPQHHFEFHTHFIPVLEHKQNGQTLHKLNQLLKSGRLREKYGGMIFTSQRAVEAWSDTMLNTGDSEDDECGNQESEDLNTTPDVSDRSLHMVQDVRTGQTFETDILTSTSFPVYVVGPATGRALDTLLSTLESKSSPQSQSQQHQHQHQQQNHPASASPFLTLNPTIHGTETGNGATLAALIRSHYNNQHRQTWYTYHDAPRLPFIPLIGMGSENYSRRRLEPGDWRLRKKPLLFLVGETRRDIIPRTLMDDGLGADRVDVVEKEVYGTVVRTAFQSEFESVIDGFGDGKLAENSTNHPAVDVDVNSVVVIVVFSPQGSRDMLRSLDFVDAQGHVTEKAKARWATGGTGSSSEKTTTTTTTTYVIVTIGPTTHDYLLDTFGFEADVCAKKPSPEGVRDGVVAFLEAKHVKR